MPTFEVEVLPEPAPPDMPDEQRARFERCLVRRFSKLTDAGKAPPVGGTIDILDNFTGKFVWEMSPDELEANPPSQVWFTVVSLEPRANDTVHAVVRIDY